MRVAILVFSFVAGVITPARAAERQWQTGTWADVSTKRQMLDFGPGSSGFGPPGAGVQMRALAEVRVCVIETENLRLEVRDTVPVNRRSIEVQVGAPVTFALDGNTVYVRDQAGIEHKFRLTKKTAKTEGDSAQTYPALGGGHLLRDVTGNGRYIVLEDGSTWEIHPRDWFQTVDWERNASITVRTTRSEDGFGFEIVNTQADEGVMAKIAPKR